jgi:hypothetical protein
LSDKFKTKLNLYLLIFFKEKALTVPSTPSTTRELEEITDELSCASICGKHTASSWECGLYEVARSMKLQVYFCTEAC